MNWFRGRAQPALQEPAPPPVTPQQEAQILDATRKLERQRGIVGRRRD